MTTTANDWQEGEYHIQPVDYDVDDSVIEDFKPHPLVPDYHFDFDAFKHCPISKKKEGDSNG